MSALDSPRQYCPSAGEMMDTFVIELESGHSTAPRVAKLTEYSALHLMPCGTGARGLQRGGHPL